MGSMTPNFRSTPNINEKILERCISVYHETVGDASRKQMLEALGRSASDLETFVRGYGSIQDPSIDTDDEILNWTFSETLADYNSAIWLLASGFYKASASSLRNAYEI